ncbi:MAG TPA: glycosyltransferase family 1 protein [Thermomicrobiales bacterium]|nr:glycosyltransferase family 1 protein [Thermomicrobiales bacterium]
MSRILVDASAAFDQRAGIGRYARNVLSRLVPLVPETEWTFFRAPAGDATEGWEPPARVRMVTYPLSRRRFDQLGVRLGLPLPIRPFTGEQSLVYSPDFTAPPLRGVPRVVTIHDIAFITHPHLTTPGLAAYLRTAIDREIRRGTWVAAVSETTRQRLIEHFPFASNRISVVPNGVDDRFLDARPLSSEELLRLGVPEQFMLMVGTVEPRKNHQGVLRAIERAGAGGLKLVVVGRPGWGTDDVARSLRELHGAGRIVWLDDFLDEQLPGLYAASRLVLYPSWTEGFGLPVLEGLATGRPVITGSDPVFREVGGQYVTVVEPGDDDALLAAIETLSEEPADQDVAAARRAHAAQYGWDRSVTMLANWLRQIQGTHR